MFLKVYIGYIKHKIENFDRDGISDIYYLTIEEIEKLLKSNPELFKTSFKVSFNLLKDYLKNK